MPVHRIDVETAEDISRRKDWNTTDFIVVLFGFGMAILAICIVVVTH